MIVALSLFQGGGYRRVMGGEISVKEWLSRASAALVALLHWRLLQTSSAAIPHDTADIHEVEADQTERMVGQVRCSASPGSLVLVLRSFETSGQRWRSFMVRPARGVLINLSWIGGWQEGPMKPWAIRVGRVPVRSPRYHQLPAPSAPPSVRSAHAGFVAGCPIQRARPPGCGRRRPCPPDRGAMKP
jgi:hypothetical protein